MASSPTPVTACSPSLREHVLADELLQFKRPGRGVPTGLQSNVVIVMSLAPPGHAARGAQTWCASALGTAPRPCWVGPSGTPPGHAGDQRQVARLAQRLGAPSGRPARMLPTSSPTRRATRASGLYQGGRRAGVRDRHQRHESGRDPVVGHGQVVPLLLRGESFPDASAAAGLILKEVGLESRGFHRPGSYGGRTAASCPRARPGGKSASAAGGRTHRKPRSTNRASGRGPLQIASLQFGLTSVLVTHNEKLAGICSRTYHLEGGRLHPV